jgi:hypothetical protein
MGVLSPASLPQERAPKLDTRYIFDTNIWIDVSQGQIDGQALRARAGTGLVLAPFTITELVRGTINGSEEQFERDQQMFKCMFDGTPEILMLTAIFARKILWNLDWGDSWVRPKHYQELLEMLINSKTLADLKRNAEAPRSSWKSLTKARSIHNAVLDRELNDLVPLAKQASIKALSYTVSRAYKCGGMIADPEVIEQRFSAAMEFLRASVLKVRRGAKPWKNDRGSYVDFQFFWYLADPRIVFVTKEDFSDDIKASPQRTRIISYDAFSHG